MKELLSKDDIDNYLLEINDQLKIMGKTGKILIAGGAALTVLSGWRLRRPPKKSQVRGEK
jgi:hypothetical protein